MIKVIQTSFWANQKVAENFALGCNGQIINIDEYIQKENDVIATHGILRGTDKILKRSKNFYYIDNGYFGSTKRSFTNKGGAVMHGRDLDGYFRIVHNNLIHSGLGKNDDKRLKIFNINFKPLRKSGEFIILSEPSQYISAFFNLKDWTYNTIKSLQKYTDRKIFVHNKKSKVRLDTLLQYAWAFVSFQSTAGFKAMINGVPAHFTHENLTTINSIKNIEEGSIDYQIFNNLSYGQWTLKEMRSGEAWSFINKKIN